jgi:ribonuclease P/MRP protein subunit RPP40
MHYLQNYGILNPGPDQVLDYFLSNDLLNQYQYGFIKVSSGVLQLLATIDNWLLNLKNGKQIDIIYTDFEKAYDNVPHKRLLSKLMSYRVDKKPTSGTKAFLCHRMQQVRINGLLSSSQRVLSGIPQGTVLGPLLFIIYINDLPEVCNDLNKTFLFADDAKIKSISGTSDCETLNNSGQHIFEWSEKWCMKLNVGKCKLLSIKGKDENIFTMASAKTTATLL